MVRNEMRWPHQLLELLCFLMRRQESSVGRWLHDEGLGFWPSASAVALLQGASPIAAERRLPLQCPHWYAADSWLWDECLVLTLQ